MPAGCVLVVRATLSFSWRKCGHNGRFRFILLFCVCLALSRVADSTRRKERRKPSFHGPSASKRTHLLKRNELPWTLRGPLMPCVQGCPQQETHNLERQTGIGSSGPQCSSSSLTAGTALVMWSLGQESMCLFPNESTLGMTSEL